jgi:hypothetical protein
MRWDASDTNGTELGNLGTNTFGFTTSYAYNINDAGIAVGYANKYDALGNFVGLRAVIWGPDGVAIDLNSLIDPASGWVLSEAHDITNDNWITGIGVSSSDGTRQIRQFLIQVPEPTSMSLMFLGIIVLRVRRRMA